MEKLQLLKKNRILKGVAIENFKAFKEYTYMPIEDISICIGPNGSGKSSYWQVLQFLQQALPKLDSKHFISLESHYSEFGTDPNIFLHDPKKPLNITLFCNIQIKNGFFIPNEVGFKMGFTPVNKGFQLETFDLVDINGSMLLSFRFQQPKEGTSSEIHFGHYWILDSSDLNELGQLLLDISYTIAKSELPDEVVKSFEFTSTQDVDFFAWDNHNCLLRYAFINTPGLFTPFSFLLEDGSINIDDTTLKGLYVQYDLDFDDENQFKNAILQASKNKNDLNAALNKSFKLIRKSFNQLLLEIKNIFILDRRFIGFSQRRLSIQGTGDNRGVFVKKFHDTYKLLNEDIITFGEGHDVIEIFNHSFRQLGFKLTPEITCDVERDECRIKIGEDNLRNSGMGYWSLTFILYSLLLCKREHKNIFVIEEPELNLHPDLQAELMDVLIELSQEWGITIIMETHSEYMLRRLQLRVHEGGTGRVTQSMIDEVNKMLIYNNFRSVKILADKVVINSFEKSKNSDSQEKPEYYCNIIRLDDLGYMDKPLPTSFSSVAANDAMILNWWLNNRIE
jgi:predicted ATPase